MLKPSPRRSSHVDISIDGNHADTMFLDDVDIEKLLDLLESAKEFWIIESKNISQIVQASVADGEFCGFEHREDSVLCTPLIETNFPTREDVKAYLAEWFTLIKA
jgi:hypothetical protein